jgi:hypothetical protein
VVLVKIYVYGMWKLVLFIQSFFWQNVRSECVKWNNFTILYEPKADKHYAVFLVEHIREDEYEAQFMNE